MALASARVSAAAFIDSFCRMGGSIEKIAWLKSTRGSELHPKIVHAFRAGYGRSECGHSWWDESLPFTWGARVPRYRVCEECSAILLPEIVNAQKA